MRLTLTKMMMRRSMMASPCEPQHWRKQQSLHDLHRQICTFWWSKLPWWGSSWQRLKSWPWFLPHSPPGLKRHDSMVKNVEEGEMAEFLLQHKEDWITPGSRKTMSWWQFNGQISHVKNLGGIENPGHHEGSLCFGAVRVVHWLAGQAAGGD